MSKTIDEFLRLTKNPPRYNGSKKPTAPKNNRLDLPPLDYGKKMRPPMPTSAKKKGSNRNI